MLIAMSQSGWTEAKPWVHGYWELRVIAYPTCQLRKPAKLCPATLDDFRRETERLLAAMEATGTRNQCTVQEQKIY